MRVNVKFIHKNLVQSNVDSTVEQKIKNNLETKMKLMILFPKYTYNFVKHVVSNDSKLNSLKKD